MKRVMVISTNRWPIPGRISLALARVGFQVAAVSPPGSLIRQIAAIHSHYRYHHWRASRSITRAIKDWSPDLLICSDDRAVQELHHIYVRAHASNNKTNRSIIALIESSLGDPASFTIAQDKSKFMPFAQSVGVRCPKTTVLPLDHVPESELEAGPFPVILKADRSFGGRGVRIANDKHDARSAFWELQFPASHPSTLKGLYARLLITLSPMWLPRPRRTVSLQENIAGRPSNRALVCQKGTVLAGISVEAVETLSKYGPATVVRVIDHAEMAVATETVVKQLNLSGFVGFDFILDAAGQAWLIEMNPRVTPTSHLCSDETNLAAALFLRLTGKSPILQTPPTKHETVILFPQELHRSPHSKHFLYLYHDVPWDEPRYVRACLNQALMANSRERVLNRLGIRSIAPKQLAQGTLDTLESQTGHEHTGDTNCEKIGALDLSIIIVSFNTRVMTVECLRSIQAETIDIDYEIIVVDNNSADSSAAAIEAEFTDVRLIALKDNIGFGRANIVAAKMARGRRLLLLNPDTVVLDRAIDRLVAFAKETPAHGIWGGRTLNGDRSLNPSSCWHRMTLWSVACYAFGLSHLMPNSSIFNPEAYGGWDRGSVRSVDIVSGCFFMIDRNLWNQLDGFNPAFFMYGEEADLCFRARKVGALPIVTPRATIVHYGGASTISTLEQRLLLFKGKATLVNRHWGPLNRRVGKALFLLGALVRWWSYWLASQFVHRPAISGVASEWRALWLRRVEWINGYAAHDARDDVRVGQLSETR